MIRKSFFIKLICLISFLSISSCSTYTKDLWTESYNEVFRNFLITKDGRSVVFIGSHYHYVFDDNSSILKDLLTWNGRNVLFIDAEETHLEVDEFNNVIGRVVIESFVNNLRPDQDVFLRSIGSRSEDGKALKVTLRLRGKRYMPQRNLSPYLPSLNRSYTIPVHYHYGPGKKMMKIALTPITVVADSIILLGHIVLLPIHMHM